MQRLERGYKIVTEVFLWVSSLINYYLAFALAFFFFFHIETCFLSVANFFLQCLAHQALSSRKVSFISSYGANAPAIC